MSNIEDDVKYVKEMLEIARVFFKTVKAETDYKDADEIAFYNAVKNILVELEQMTKRYEERDDELWERIKQCHNLQTEIDRLYLDKEELIEINRKQARQIEELEEENYVQKIQIYENSIPKQIVIDRIRDLKLSGGSNGKDNVENLVRELAIDILQELLEGEK